MQKSENNLPMSRRYTAIIYLIRNTVNGKVYVGQTKQSIKVRWQQHKSNALMGRETHFYRAIRKHGAESFTIEELVRVTPDVINDTETALIAAWESTDPAKGYNSTFGGEGSGPATLESRKRMSEAWHRDPARITRHRERLDRLHQQNVGRKTDNSTRTLLSQSLLGKSKTDEHRRNISRGRKGKTFSSLSEDHRRKIADSHRGDRNHFFGRSHSEESRRKISQAKTGKTGWKQTPETIAKMLASRERNRLAKLAHQAA